MYKLIRFYNQNRNKIIKIILIIVLIIGLIQLLNYLVSVKNKNIQSGNIENINKITEENNNQLISNKSIISGQSITTSKLKKDTQVIDEFVKLCNEKQIDSAYDLLTQKCKDIMFPTVQNFYDIYYSKIFNGESRNYTLENWVGDIYQIKYTEDILTSGNLNNSKTIQDYITISNQNGENKININSYIESRNINRITKNKNLEITITEVEVYMDYEIYNLTIKNNSDNIILLDTSDDLNSIYLQDNKGMKYYFYNNEILDNKLLIKSGFTTNLQIKFNNTYTSNRKISNLVFSKLVLNYDEYKSLENKEEYQFYTYVINI